MNKRTLIVGLFVSTATLGQTAAQGGDVLEERPIQFKVSSEQKAISHLDQVIALEEQIQNLLSNSKVSEGDKQATLQKYNGALRSRKEEFYAYVEQTGVRTVSKREISFYLAYKKEDGDDQTVFQVQSDLRK